MSGDGAIMVRASSPLIAETVIALSPPSDLMLITPLWLPMDSLVQSIFILIVSLSSENVPDVGLTEIQELSSPVSILNLDVSFPKLKIPKLNTPKIPFFSKSLLRLISFFLSPTLKVKSFGVTLRLGTL